MQCGICVGLRRGLNVAWSTANHQPSKCKPFQMLKAVQLLPVLPCFMVLLRFDNALYEHVRDSIELLSNLIKQGTHKYGARTRTRTN